MKNLKIPFTNLSREATLHLFFAAIVTFYALLVGQEVIFGNICGGLSYDYCAYWSGGRVINEYGYKEIFNPDLMLEVQRSLYPQAQQAPTLFEEVPLPYLPFFMVPFKFLSLIDLPFSYFIWTLINFLGFWMYLRFFIKSITGGPAQTKHLLIVLFSLPVFLNLYYGQLNVWLGICAGEFIRGMINKKPIKAGLWLGGWLLKPQLLVLIVPAMFLKRQFKGLLGFILASLAIILISWGMVGKEGLVDLFRLITSSSQGGAASNPQAMMNFRMLGVYVNYYIHNPIGWVIVIIGSLVTVIFSLISFASPKNSDRLSIALSSLGLFAATCAVTWHAHIHMLMVLLPALLLVIQGRSLNKLFTSWFILPPIVMLLIYVVAGLAQTGFLPKSLIEIFNLLLGLIVWVFNLIILKWTADEYNKNANKINGTAVINRCI